MKVYICCALLALWPSLTVAQSLDVVTVIPEQGILLREGKSQSTFIPQAGIAVGQFNTATPGGIKDMCSWCGCCVEVNAKVVATGLSKAGRKDLASDHDVLKKAVNIDLKKIPKW